MGLMLLTLLQAMPTLHQAHGTRGVPWRPLCCCVAALLAALLSTSRGYELADLPKISAAVAELSHKGTIDIIGKLKPNHP